MPSSKASSPSSGAASGIASSAGEGNIGAAGGSKGSKASSNLCRQQSITIKIQDPQIAKIRGMRETVRLRLSAVQKQLYDIENAYLENSTANDNVVKGWDGFIDSKPSRHNATKKDRKFKPTERVFSYSSVSAPIVHHGNAATSGGGSGSGSQPPLKRSKTSGSSGSSGQTPRVRRAESLSSSISTSGNSHRKGGRKKKTSVGGAFSGIGGNVDGSGKSSSAVSGAG